MESKTTENATPEAPLPPEPSSVAPAPADGAAAGAPDAPPDGQATLDPSPEKTLALYRGLLLTLVVALIGAWLFWDRVDKKQQRLIAQLKGQADEVAGMMGGQPPAGAARPAQPPDHLTVTDIGARLDLLSRESPEATDLEETYFKSKDAAVHLHVMAPEQTDPLHLRRSEEVAVVVSGAAEVTHVYGKGGSLATQVDQVAAGGVVDSPALAGHQWVNGSKSARLASLVFAPQLYQDDFYLKPTDERMLKGGAPLAYDFAGDLKDLAAGTEPNHRRQLPAMGGRVSALVVKGSASLEPHPAHPVIIYVARGSGTLDNGQKQPVKQQNLAVIHGSRPVTLTAEGGALAVVVYEPEPASAEPPSKPASP